MAILFSLTQLAASAEPAAINNAKDAIAKAVKCTILNL